MHTHRGLWTKATIAVTMLFVVVGCDPVNGPGGSTHPQVLDSVQVVGAAGGTLNARSFALSGIVKESSDSFDIELAVDLGTAAQRVDTFRARPSSEDGQFAEFDLVPAGRRWLLLHRDTLTNGTHTIRVVFVGLSRDTVSLSLTRQVADVVYDAQALPGIGGADSFGADLNSSGIAAGRAPDASGIMHAVRWAAGVATVLSGGESSAAAINELGAIVGQYGNSVAIWDSAGQRVSSVIGKAYDIDSRGRDLVAYSTSDGYQHIGVQDGDSLTEIVKCDGRGPCGYVIPVAMNDSGEVIYQYLVSLTLPNMQVWPGTTSYPFPKVYGPLCGFDGSAGIRINNRHEILASAYSQCSIAPRISLIRPTGTIDLSWALNAAYRTAPVDLGKDGSVVALDRTTNTITVWRDGVVTGARIPAGWTIDGVQRIAAGRILAHASNNGAKSAVLLTPR
jgi:hypothetical protein